MCGLEQEWAKGKEVASKIQDTTGCLWFKLLQDTHVGRSKITQLMQQAL